jgi:hypothetical protein
VGVASWFRKRATADPKPAEVALRDTLFGDVPLVRWGARAGDAPPGSHFADARRALARDDRAAAIAALHAVLAIADAESRQTLQAWHSLRALGEAPPPGEAKRVLGVVLEVHVDAGLDVLAAYADHTARFLSHGGGVIVWEAHEPALDERIDALLRAGQTVTDRIGPWTEPRRGPPPKGDVRLNFLTPSGLHFGEGGFDELDRDPLAHPVIVSGTVLMQALTERTRTEVNP